MLSCACSVVHHRIANERASERADSIQQAACEFNTLQTSRDAIHDYKRLHNGRCILFLLFVASQSSDRVAPVVLNESVQCRVRRGEGARRTPLLRRASNHSRRPSARTTHKRRDAIVFDCGVLIPIRLLLSLLLGVVLHSGTRRLVSVAVALIDRCHLAPALRHRSQRTSRRRTLSSWLPPLLMSIPGLRKSDDASISPRGQPTDATTHRPLNR